MTSQPSNQLYLRVVKVTHIYLGPAADRFIARQVQSHLHKPPESLSHNDLLQLIDWIRAAMSLLTEDSDLVDEYASELLRLAQTGQRLNQS